MQAPPTENIIYVDTREPEQPVIPNITFVRETMAYGDYRWDGIDGPVVVERKSTNDLISSIQDGRWQRQLSHLVESGRDAYLLIERFGAAGLNSGWTFEGVDQAVTIAQRCGITVCYYWPGRIGFRLLSLFQSTRREGHSTLVTPRKRVIGLSPRESSALSILASLPGSGPGTARRLLGRYRSPSNVFDAISSGEPVEGIGSKKLSTWREVLGYDKS